MTGVQLRSSVRAVNLTIPQARTRIVKTARLMIDPGNLGYLRRNPMKVKIAMSGLAVAFVVLIPRATFGQSGFAGVARDTTGAVLPGVTVEAASPALIEKA